MQNDYICTQTHTYNTVYRYIYNMTMRTERNNCVMETEISAQTSYMCEWNKNKSYSWQKYSNLYKSAAATGTILIYRCVVLHYSINRCHCNQWQIRKHSCGKQLHQPKPINWAKWLLTIKICYKQSRFELLCFLQLSHTHFSRAQQSLSSALEVSRWAWSEHY